MKSQVNFSFFSKSDLELIHDTTMKLMGEHGVQIFGDTALEIYSAAGCEVDRSSHMVKFPREVVESAIDSSPDSFLMAGRDPKFDCFIEPGNVTYTNFGTGVMIEDIHTGELRKTTKHDLADVARFCDAVDEIETFTIAIAAQDVPEKTKELHEAEAVFHNTTKHFGHDTLDGRTTRYFIRMAEAVAGGREKLMERPIVSLGTCPNSPLQLHEDSTDIIIEAAKARLPMDILSMAMAGGTSPVTLPGTLVVTNAEILSGIVLSQLVSKGTPVIYGSSSTIMDLIHTTSPVGAPEHGMLGAAVSQLGQYYGIPTDVGGL